jgi:hypothetical protein
MSSSSGRVSTARARFKECVCGRIYSRESWNRIPSAGFMIKGKDVAGELVELKLCACGSSIAVDLGDEPDSLPTIRAARPARRDSGS